MTILGSRVGLALSGGGAHGAWEAGVVARLDEAGVRFRRAWGFSAGALNATAYALGLTRVNAEIWTTIEKQPAVLVPSLRDWPRAIFSDQPLRRQLGRWVDEVKARDAAIASLHIATFCIDDGLPHVAHFEQGGRWDSPMIDHIVASCAIPLVFPPVRIGRDGTARTFVDGGVLGQKPLDLECLADCTDIVTVSVVRPDETQLWETWNPIRALNLRGKKVMHKQMTAAISSVATRERRVHSIVPGRPLDFSFLNFSPKRCRQAYQLGRDDAETFLRTLH